MFQTCFNNDPKTSRIGLWNISQSHLLRKSTLRNKTMDWTFLGVPACFLHFPSCSFVARCLFLAFPSNRSGNPGPDRFVCFSYRRTMGRCSIDFLCVCLQRLSQKLPIYLQKPSKNNITQLKRTHQSVHEPSQSLPKPSKIMKRNVCLARKMQVF